VEVVDLNAKVSQVLYLAQKLMYALAFAHLAGFAQRIMSSETVLV